MDLQADKLNLIEWLEGIDDDRIIKQFVSLQQSNQKQSSLTTSEKAAIDQGLKSISEGNTHTHESVMKSTKEKYPNLFV